MSYDIVFKNETSSPHWHHQLASGYISETKVFFRDEGVVAVVQAKGSVEFFDTEGKLIASGSVPQNSGGREVYEQIRLQVEDGLIKLHFPITEWVDNYPHCDGEHDRWDSRITGYHVLALDKASGTVL